MLLIGSTKTTGRVVVIEASVYLDARGLLYVEELAGVHPLPALTEDLSVPGAQARLAAAATRRADDLGMLTAALAGVDSARREPDPDIRADLLADSANALMSIAQPDSELSELSTLMAANVLGWAGNIDDAESLYVQLLGTSVDKRARLGLAQVRHVRSVQLTNGCSTPDETGTLDMAIAEFQAITSEGTNPGENIDHKAGFGLARSSFCRSRSAGDDPDPRDIKNLEQIAALPDAELRDSDLRILVAESHALLGVMAADDSTSSLEEASVHFDDALAITSDSRRRADFQIGWIRILLNAEGFSERTCAEISQLRATGSAYAERLEAELALDNVARNCV